MKKLLMLLIGTAFASHAFAVKPPKTHVDDDNAPAITATTATATPPIVPAPIVVTPKKN